MDSVDDLKDTPSTEIGVEEEEKKVEIEESKSTGCLCFRPLEVQALATLEVELMRQGLRPVTLTVMGHGEVAKRMFHKFLRDLLREKPSGAESYGFPEPADASKATAVDTESETHLLR